MKVTMTFDLPDERAEFSYAMRGQDWASMYEDMVKYLRDAVNGTEYVTAAEAFERAYDKIWDLQREHGLSVWVEGGEWAPPPEEAENA